jgi:hypothetical protein
MIIGLSGFARVGKDEMCRICLAHAKAFGFEVSYRHSFADALKKECQLFLDMTFPGKYDVINNTADKVFWRDLLVTWGERCRAIDPDYWIKRLLENPTGAKLLSDDPKTLHVITDARYPNEAAWIKDDLGGQVVRLSRTGFGPANSVEEKSIKEIDDQWLYDHHVLNSYKSLELFEAAIVDFLKNILGR